MVWRWEGEKEPEEVKVPYSDNKQKDHTLFYGPLFSPAM